MSMVNDLLALSYVPRWSIVPHLRPQSVAEHTFRMLAIAVDLADRMDIELSQDALIAGLVHDGPESRSGDIPSTAKRRIEDRLGGSVDLMFWKPMRQEAAMSQDETAVLTLADKIEGCTYIRKWGVGPHAVRVAELCRQEVLSIAKVHSDAMIKVVVEMLTEIEEEYGR